MKLFTKEELRDLTAIRDTPCVSIFIPTERAGQEVQKARIELKNQLGKAYEKLAKNGMRAPKAEEMLKSAKELLDDTMFWQYQSDGLAVFLSDNVFQYYRVPIRFNAMAVVKNHFYVKPMLPLFGSERSYYVLAASQNLVRLIQCGDDGAKEVSVSNMPLSLAEALKYDDPEKSLNYHTNSHHNGQSVAVFHGLGGGTEDNKTNILRFFKMVDHALLGYLSNDRSPLILFAVDYLHPIFSAASSLDHLMKDGIVGNPDEMSIQQIMNISKAYMEPFFQKDEKQAIRQYDQYRAGGRTSEKLKEIISAAISGRVETLFVTDGLQYWGFYDERNDMVHKAGKYNPDSEDLYEMAAVHTLFHDGKVFVESPEQMPKGAEVAAILRY